jgi:quercetin dioxygenase-like cupin family protein
MTAARHLVRRAADAAYVSASAGFRRWTAVDEAAGAVHTGFGICELDPGTSVPAHVHSYEQSFFMLDGSARLTTAEGTFLLRAGDYGLVPIGVPHSWRCEDEPERARRSDRPDQPARWALMEAPAPRARHDDDTFAVSEPPGGEPVPVDVRDPRTRSFGHITPANMDVDKQTQDMLAVSASMRTALLVYSGITVKMMVDTDLGAQLSTMFMVRYDPDGAAGAHDHPFEETYLILEGTVEATFDDARYLLKPGDIAWAGVGCVHAFANAGEGTVRWLETQAPQPPARHSYRFARDWDYLRGGS